jgi:L-fuconolactonase
VSELIDAHVHLWNRATDPQPWIDADTMPSIDRDFDATDLSGMLVETEVGRAVLVQSSNSAGETIRLLTLAAEHDEIAGVVGWIDLTADATEQLERIPAELRRHLVGIRHLVHIDPDENWLDRDDVQRGLAVLAPAGLTFDLVVRWWQLAAAARTVARHPDLTDTSRDLAGWEAGLRAVAGQPNASSKLSGLSALIANDSGIDLSQVVGTAFDAFGADRLMYGSDWPLSQLGAGVVRWRGWVQDALGRTDAAERAAVLGGNATRLYRLDRP